MRAAVEYIADHGFRVAMDLPMEEIITAADVSRATAYRLWPSREEFSAAVLEKLAEGQVLPVLDRAGMEEVVREVDARTLGATAAIDVACDLLGAAVSREFEALIASHGWRAFVAYEAVVASLSDARQRGRLLRRIADVDEQHDRRLGELYRAVVAALGLRPTAPDALSDVAHSARLLDRGFAHEVLRGDGSAGAIDVVRRRLSVSSAALLRGALESDGRMPPVGWPRAVLDAVEVQGVMDPERTS